MAMGSRAGASRSPTRPSSPRPGSRQAQAARHPRPASRARSSDAGGAPRGAPRAQLALPLSGGWGGARPGAGRKPGSRRATPHRARPEHRSYQPVHVTLRAALGPLRSQHLFPTVRLALVRSGRATPESFRIVQFSVQNDHLHLIVEARSKRALSSGMRSLAIRTARYVNDLLQRRGRFWADRWHGRALTSPREVRAGLVYVLANFRKHARRPPPLGIDPCSSAAWFGGFAGYHPGRDPVPYASGLPPPSQGVGVPVSPARTWLVTTGWRRLAPLGLAEAPAGPRDARKARAVRQPRAPRRESPPLAVAPRRPPPCPPPHEAGPTRGAPTRRASRARHESPPSDHTPRSLAALVAPTTGPTRHSTRTRRGSP